MECFEIKSIMFGGLYNKDTVSRRYLRVPRSLLTLVAALVELSNPKVPLLSTQNPKTPNPKP